MRFDFSLWSWCETRKGRRAPTTSVNGEPVGLGVVALPSDAPSALRALAFERRSLVETITYLQVPSVASCSFVVDDLIVCSSCFAGRERSTDATRTRRNDATSAFFRRAFVVCDVTSIAAAVACRRRAPTRRHGVVGVDRFDDVLALTDVL